MKTRVRTAGDRPNALYSRPAFDLKANLAPHQKLGFPFVERNEQWESYQLSTSREANWSLFISRKYLDDKTRVVLEAIIALKDRVAGAEARLQISKEVAEIAQDSAPAAREQSAD